MYKTLPLSSYNFKIDLKENNYIILINMKFILTIYKFDINGMIYIGSSWEYDIRKSKHKYDCYNELSRNYYCEIYKYIRDNNIDWNDITIEDIYNKELDEKNKLLKRQTEQIYIEKYDSKNNGLNTYNAYTTEEERKEQLKEYYENHKEELKEKQKEYYENNKEEKKEKQKEYYENHKEELKEKQKEYREKHKEKQKEYHENHKEYYKKYQKEYREKHKEKQKEYHRLKYERDREKILAHKKNIKMCGEIVNELINSLF